jgi:SAM-dependent methyltransferase
MRDDYWFSPANLEKTGRDCELADPESLTSGDFASYAKSNRGKGLKDSGIESHNLLDPYPRVRFYSELVERNAHKKIADLGCGLGFTSGALAEIFCTDNVTGYEVSLDAVQYAEKRWPRLKFIAGAVIENTKLQESYDLVIAQEFYPFTRTSDFNVHDGYLMTIFRSLNRGGVVLIGLAEGGGTIIDNINKLDSILGRFGAHLSVHHLPFDRIYKIVKNYSIASILSCMVHYLIGKRRFCVLKIKLNSDSK